MNHKEYLLLAGRPNSGKTEIMIHYANQYPLTTLFISEEYAPNTLYRRGLSNHVRVIGSESLNNVKFNNYKTICIDYLQLFEKDIIQTLLKKLAQMDVRIILASSVHQNTQIDNLFKTPQINKSTNHGR